MRKVIVSMFVTLDELIVGSNEEMDWVLNIFDDEEGKDIGDLLSSVDTILLGRVTYQIMANYWPSATTNDDPGADYMNNIPKMVFSKTLEKVEWGKWNNATLVKENIGEEVKKMKTKVR